MEDLCHELDIARRQDGQIEQMGATSSVVGLWQPPPHHVCSTQVFHRRFHHDIVLAYLDRRLAIGNYSPSSPEP